MKKSYRDISSFQIAVVLTYSIKIMIQIKIEKIKMKFWGVWSLLMWIKNSFSIRLGIIFVFWRKNAFFFPNQQN